MCVQVFSREGIPGNVSEEWRHEKGKGMLMNQLLLWASGIQFCWGAAIDHVECTLRLSQQGGKAGINVSKDFHPSSTEVALWHKIQLLCT